MDNKERERVIKLIGMLGSAFDGERANAAGMLSSIAEKNRMTINELMELAYTGEKPGKKPYIMPDDAEPDFTDIDQASDLLRMLQRIAERPDMASRVLTAWEINFATDVAARYSADYELSEKQLVVTEKILRKASRVFK